MNDIAVRSGVAAGAGAATYVTLDAHAGAVLAAGIACFLVRLPLIRRKTLLADICLCGLAIMGACLTASDHNLPPAKAMYLGVGFGAAASTLIEICKSATIATFKTNGQAVLRVLFGIKGAKDL